MPEPSIARSRYLFRSHHFLDSFPKYGRSNDAKHNTLHAASEGPAPVYPNPVAWSSHPTQHKQDNTADQGGPSRCLHTRLGGRAWEASSFHFIGLILSETPLRMRYANKHGKPSPLQIKELRLQTPPRECDEKNSARNSARPIVQALKELSARYVPGPLHPSGSHYIALASHFKHKKAAEDRRFLSSKRAPDSSKRQRLTDFRRMTWLKSRFRSSRACTCDPWPSTPPGRLAPETMPGLTRSL